MLTLIWRRAASPRAASQRKFRHDVPGHGAGAQGAATVAERARECAARPCRLQPVVVAAEAGRRQSRAAEGRSAGPCDGTRRRRHQLAGFGATLCGVGTSRFLWKNDKPCRFPFESKCWNFYFTGWMMIMNPKTNLEPREVTRPPSKLFALQKLKRARGTGQNKE